MKFNLIFDKTNPFIIFQYIVSCFGSVELEYLRYNPYLNIQLYSNGSKEDFFIVYDIMKTSIHFSPYFIMKEIIRDNSPLYIGEEDEI